MHKLYQRFTLSLFSILVCTTLLQAQSSEELMATGQQLLQNGAYSEAAARFRKVVSQDGSNFEAHHNLAFALLQQGKHAEAVKAFKSAIALNGKSSETWANLAIAYEGLDKYKEALQALATAVNLDPGNIDYRLNLATSYANQNQTPSAIAEYKEIIRIDARKFVAYNNLAKCLIDQNKHEEAKTYLSQLLDLDPANSEAHWLMGNILWKKDHALAKAAQEYETAVKLESTSQIYYENWGLLLEEMGKKDDAISVWKSYITYLDDPIVKENIRKHLDQLERGPSAQGPEKTAASSNTLNTDEADKLKQELRGTDKKPSRIRDTGPSIDISNDFQDINKQEPVLDLKEEARRKAAKKKE